MIFNPAVLGLDAGKYECEACGCTVDVAIAINVHGDNGSERRMTLCQVCTQLILLKYWVRRQQLTEARWAQAKAEFEEAARPSSPRYRRQ